MISQKNESNRFQKIFHVNVDKNGMVKNVISNPKWNSEKFQWRSKVSYTQRRLCLKSQLMCLNYG